MKLINDDCILAMREMPDNSVDSIVTDPPYELGFMGKSWDSTGIAFNVEVWQEALRVLKPGGHLLAFSGSRTYHRMAVAIEDAGFEIRDQIMWVYGSGFPKSHNISKGIDKGSGENKNRQIQFVMWMRSTGITAKQINDATNTQMASHYIGFSQPAIATADLFDSLRPYLPEVPEEIERLVAERTGIEWTAYKNRAVLKEDIRVRNSDSWEATGGMLKAGEQDFSITAPATDDAKQWDGWGTALKPAHEPIVLARKPLVGTVANNVLTFGTGGLNIDGSRVGSEGGSKRGSEPSTHLSPSGAFNTGHDIVKLDAGRFPANFIHDGSDEVLALFPDTKAGIAKRGNSGGNNFGSDTPKPPLDDIGYGDSGSAARFFYCAKASKRDRNEGLEGFEVKSSAELVERKEGSAGMDSPRAGAGRTSGSANHHPTVKPTDLMRYLCRLITPPNGTVLDPFMGSGSTGKACAYEGFDFIGIEQSAEYVEIARARIAFVEKHPEQVIFPKDFERDELVFDFTDKEEGELA